MDKTLVICTYVRIAEDQLINNIFMSGKSKVPIELKALKAITAWRQLDALKLLNKEERSNIKEKIMALYGKYLSPLRTEQKD